MKYIRTDTYSFRQYFTSRVKLLLFLCYVQMQQLSVLTVS